MFLLMNKRTFHNTLLVYFRLDQIIELVIVFRVVKTMLTEQNKHRFKRLYLNLQVLFEFKARNQEVSQDERVL